MRGPSGMVDELDRVQTALAKGQSDLERERIRSMLVANETSVKDKLFDQLGGIYLDVVSLVPLIRNEDSLVLAASIRGSLISELRRIARGRRFVDRWLNAPLWTWPLIAVVVAVGLLLVYGEETLRYPERVVAPVATTSLVLTGSFWALTAFVRYWRVRRWERALKELQRRLETPPSAHSATL